MGEPLTLGHWVDFVQPRLPPELLSEAAVRSVRTLARRFPAAGLMVLEARLSLAGDAHVDFSFRMTDPAFAAEVARQVEPAGLQGFLRSWAEGDPGAERVSAVWLEFDLDGPLPEPSNPSVCAKLRSPVPAGWLEEGLLPRLQGRPLDEAQRLQVRTCLEAIPPPAHLLYVFCMLSRPGRPLRLEIYGLGPDAMLDYLARVAPRVLPQVRGPAALFEGIERTHLSLDLIDGEISPRVGIEGSYARQPRREPRWDELFGRLVAAGLCSDGKREAALGWPGWDSFWTAPERWPVEAVGAAGYCVRSLSHVKVVCQPDRPPEAKAYLGVEWLRERPGQ